MLRWTLMRHSCVAKHNENDFGNSASRLLLLIMISQFWSRLFFYCAIVIYKTCKNVHEAFGCALTTVNNCDLVYYSSERQSHWESILLNPIQFTSYNNIWQALWIRAVRRGIKFRKDGSRSLSHRFDCQLLFSYEER